jgi:TolB-like protein
MKWKQIFTTIIALLFGSSILFAESIAVSNLNTHGVELTPEIAAKLTRIELIKIEKYVVLDEFDMRSALEGDEQFTDCYGKSCLIRLGQKLEVDYVLSGSIDALGTKIVVSLKLVDINNQNLKTTKSLEFADQPTEIARMIEIVLREMFGLESNEETKKRLLFNDELIVSNNLGRINNSGPRFGISAAVYGDLNKFFQRTPRTGGLGIYPIMSNLGYQFEFQYIGTENFSALFEIIPNLGGMEQGQFIPSISFLNGFRFGQSGWEFAFGPSFGMRKVINGIVSDEDGIFYTEQEWFDKDYESWSADPNNVDTLTGVWLNEYEAPSKSIYSKRLDTRGVTELNATWLMAFGRTFRAGALNIPVNFYYSGSKYGALAGVSVGFNIVTQKKSAINK